MNETTNRFAQDDEIFHADEWPHGFYPGMMDEFLYQQRLQAHWYDAGKNAFNEFYRCAFAFEDANGAALPDALIDPAFNAFRMGWTDQRDTVSWWSD